MASCPAGYVLVSSSAGLWGWQGLGQGAVQVVVAGADDIAQLVGKICHVAVGIERQVYGGQDGVAVVVGAGFSLLGFDQAQPGVVVILLDLVAGADDADLVVGVVGEARRSGRAGALSRDCYRTVTGL